MCPASGYDRLADVYRFFFDAGSGTVLWDDSGYVHLADLPVSADLRNVLEELVARYDSSLDWDDPTGPGPWSAAECREFNTAVRAALARLRVELGTDIADGFRELREDLAGPGGFSRRGPG
ncbi:hypothetical protein GCM10029964_041800 [Kibdelosporangium lantanae]